MAKYELYLGIVEASRKNLRGIEVFYHPSIASADSERGAYDAFIEYCKNKFPERDGYVDHRAYSISAPFTDNVRWILEHTEKLNKENTTCS